MQPRTDILMAKVLGAHGVRGWTKLFWHGADPGAAMTYKRLHNAAGQVFEIAEWRMQGKTLAVKFKGIDDRDAAEKLNGTELFIARSALPAPSAGEYYHVDLIGLAAQTATGEHLGVVKSIQNFGAGDLLELEKLSGETEFILFDTNTIQTIDFEAEIITIFPPLLVE